MCRVGCVLFIKPWHHTLHISELKYAPTHGTFTSFLEIDKTAGAYSLQIYDYLSQIQRETSTFLQIARHNTEGLPFSDWQWRRMLFFFVGLKNRVNLVLFFKPWNLQLKKLFNNSVANYKVNHFQVNFTKHFSLIKFKFKCVIIIIIIILLKQDYKVQLANSKIRMAWLTCWLVVG